MARGRGRNGASTLISCPGSQLESGDWGVERDGTEATRPILTHNSGSKLYQIATNVHFLANKKIKSPKFVIKILFMVLFFCNENMESIRLK